ncbi:hypothetical protein EXIGLDRAFT_820813 [Exidia glandulosa HHB12029]|uniref:DUF6535 domain-containing protein n=1 Tax=Exidia glandulosa HHB12029 TaxID=1314781 RepID=A0A165JTR1_EXIGL|nr:hypothetical protein EXIGLDRAFT_820813 [Exidia glandulosa HHB12029]
MSALPGISRSVVPVHHAHTVQADPTPTVPNEPQQSNPAPPTSGFTSIGHELDPTAPLWRVYRDEVRNHDRDVTLDEWNKTLDILLIFLTWVSQAGLFSAVITSFLIASYPLLNPEDDNEAVVNAIQTLAMAINSSITLLTPKPQEPVTASILWVNGLWFASLFIALAVAFFAILAKQWLVEYNHRMADPPAAVAASLTERNDHATVALPTRTADPEAPNPAPASTTLSLTAPTADAEAPKLPSASNGLSPTASLAWARRRQFFFSAFESWHVPALITQVLPFLLHVALFLFLVGLSVFVWTLNKRIARGMTVLTAFLFCLYLIATFLPVLRVECPTATPLVRRAREAPIWISIKAVQLWHSILPTALTAFGLSPAALERVITDLSQRQKNIRDSGWLEGGMTTDDNVKLDTLWWLIFVSGSETAVTAAFQAVGALPADSPILDDIKKLTASMDTAIERLGNSLTPPTAIEIIRAVRSELVLGRGSWDLPLLGLDLSPLHTKTLQESQHPEARLLSAAMHLDGTLYDYARTTKARSFSSLYDITDALLRGNRSSDSCLSTARLLLNLPGITGNAFGCLSVILARALHVDESDKALILHVFNHLLETTSCYASPRPHKCDGLGLYRTLRSPSLIPKVQDTRTCEADKRPSMLQDLCLIVHRVKTDPNVISTVDDDVRMHIHALAPAPADMLPCSDEESRYILFQNGLIPEIGACFARMWQPLEGLRQELFVMVNAALGSLYGKVDDKEEYLLHVAQHCVELNPKWPQSEAVRAHLDPQQMEKRLAEQAYHPDVAPASSTPNALSAFHVESGTIPNLPAATGSGPSAPSVGSHPVIASLSVPPGYSVLVSASNSPAVLDPPSGTTPSLVIIPSTPTTATSTVPTPADGRAPEVSPAAAGDDIRTLVVSQPERAPHGADLAHEPPSAVDTASSGDEERFILAPRVRNASGISSPAESVIGANSFSSVSAHDVPATSRSVPESGTDAVGDATTVPSPYPPAAPSQVGTASASLSEPVEDVEVASASSAE